LSNFLVLISSELISSKSQDKKQLIGVSKNKTESEETLPTTKDQNITPVSKKDAALSMLVKPVEEEICQDEKEYDLKNVRAARKKKFQGIYPKKNVCAWPMNKKRMCRLLFFCAPIC